MITAAGAATFQGKMQERLLQYIWQEKYFNTNHLLTEGGEKLVIIDSGTWNNQQGPDFLDARLLLNGTRWAGHVEIHLKSSHWYQHHHTLDPNYRNVILHVVWEDDDKKLSCSLPTLVLQHRVPSIMLGRYEELMQQNHSIACQDSLPLVSSVLWEEWKANLLRQRLERKSSMVLNNLEIAKNNWEESTWWWVARHFGGPVNAVFFEQVAKSLSTKILSRHRNNIIQLEALLLGQGNFLQESNSDSYVQLLQREYQFLKNKYQLSFVHGQAQLLRMRPAGFPAIRLAQLAMLVHQSGRLHFSILESDRLKDMEKLLELTANDFWHYHYTLNEPTPYQPKHLGKEMQQNLLINAITPLLFAYGTRQHQANLVQRAINWLSELEPETNSIIRGWKVAGVQARNAADTQSLTELKKCYCNARKCLDCQVGRFLMNR